MTNSSNKVLYIGVTSDIIKRANEDRTLKCVGFSSKYRCIKLVYLECCNSIWTLFLEKNKLKDGSEPKKLI